MPNFTRPEPPIFERVEEERLHRKQRLAAAFRVFARFGFSEGFLSKHDIGHAVFDQ